jgi:hypothetical protein
MNDIMNQCKSYSSEEEHNAVHYLGTENKICVLLERRNEGLVRDYEARFKKPIPTELCA